MWYERMDKNINFTNAAKKMSPVSMMPMSCACFEGRERGEANTGELKSTYIENVILRPSQISSFHHPRPGSLIPSENKIRVGYRLSQAIPPRFFAMAGSAANSSSFPCIAKRKKELKKSTNLRSRKVYMSYASPYARSWVRGRKAGALRRMYSASSASLWIDDTPIAGCFARTWRSGTRRTS